MLWWAQTLPSVLADFMKILCILSCCKQISSWKISQGGLNKSLYWTSFDIHFVKNANAINLLNLMKYSIKRRCISFGYFLRPVMSYLHITLYFPLLSDGGGWAGGWGGGWGGIKVVPESLRNSLTLPGWNKWRCLNKDTGTGKMNFQKHCLLQFTNRIKTQQKNTKVTFFAIWNSWPCFPTMLIINMNLSHWF